MHHTCSNVYFAIHDHIIAQGGRVFTSASGVIATRSYDQGMRASSSATTKNELQECQIIPVSVSCTHRSRNSAVLQLVHLNGGGSCRRSTGSATR